MNYVIWDVETDSADTNYATIIEIGALLLDENFREKERFSARCRIPQDRVPSATALCVNRSSIDLLTKQNLSHYQMLNQIEAKFKEWSPACFLGYSSINFDDEVIRKEFFKTLREPYITNTKGNVRHDALNIVRAAFAINPEVLNTELNAKGNISMKLESLGRMNGYDTEAAHSALFDSELCGKILSEIKEKQTNLWDDYLRTSSKQSVEEIIKKSCNPLSSSEFEYLSKKNCIILDVRSKFDFSRSHIPKSLFIGLEGNFAPWAGSVIGDIKTPILLVTDKNKEKETIKRLARVGFDNILGYLYDGIEGWVKNGRKIDSINNVNADEILTKPLEIIDVRTPAEHLKKHVESSINLPLNNYKKNKLKTLSNNPFYVHCQSGYRSLIYLSILKKSGIHNGLNVKGGFKSIEKLLD